MAITVRARVDPMAILAAKQALEAAAKGVTPHEATLGVHEEDGTKPKRWYSGAEVSETLAEIMAMHEYGVNVPERSFIRTYFDTHAAALAIGMFQAMREEADGDKDAVRRWLDGVYLAWKDWIASGNNLSPLAPITVLHKTQFGLPHPDVPLVATEQFIDAFKAKLDGRPL